MKSFVAIIVCLGIVGCNGITSATPTSTATYTAIPSATITLTLMATITSTPSPTNTPPLPAKADCALVGWLDLYNNLEHYVGKCIYLEGRVIAYADPTELLYQPDDEGKMVIRPPEPNSEQLYLEATVHGDQVFFKALDSLIVAEQGWIAIWGTFQDERFSIDPNNPSPAAGYPLDGYMLYAASVEALSPCPINQARIDEGNCADTTPTPDPLHSDKSDGFYLVGIDIAPGVWRSNGSGDDCYWATTTAHGELIANHFGMAGGTAYISPDVFQVEFNNCGIWKFLSPP